MTLRITLLVLVTSLFAMIWTQDQPPANRRLPVRADHREHDQPAMAEKPPRLIDATTEISPDEKMKPLRVVDSRAEIPMDGLWMFGGLEMPLPAGIVPGEYRIVSGIGIVRNVTLTLDDLTAYHQSQSALVTRDVYQSEDETGRWYFIRVQSDPAVIVPVIAERGKHKTLPAMAARDEAWRARQQANRLIGRFGRKLVQGLWLRDGLHQWAEEMKQTIRIGNEESRPSSEKAKSERL